MECLSFSYGMMKTVGFYLETSAESNQSEEIKKFLFEFSIEGIEKNKVQQPPIGKKEFYKIKKRNQS